MIDSKKCSCCGETKPRGDFAPKKSDGPNGLQAYCRPCSLAKSRAWAARNKERKLEHKRTSRAADPDRARANNRRHYANHADRLREEARARTPEERVKRAKRQKAYRIANPEKIRQNNRARVHTQRAAGKVTKEVIDFLIKMQSGCCAVCKKHTVVAGKGFHLDHKNPLAKGGTNDRDNLQILCPLCNLAKNARDPIEFMQSCGYLI